ncbi:MAG: hypothetical protein ABI178_15000 [Rhodanobacter sp.]
MTTNADAIAALVKAKATLQAQCDAASVSTLKRLTSSINSISSEIGALAAAALNNAIYVPVTDSFRKVTDDAKVFLATLNKLKTTFANASEVVGVLDSVINLVTRLCV